MTDRSGFERWYSSNGGIPKVIERRPDGGYKLMQAEAAWGVWKAAVAAEREACAKVCEKAAMDDKRENERLGWSVILTAPKTLAATIRARSTAEPAK